jgi:hypothetical protein
MKTVALSWIGIAVFSKTIYRETGLYSKILIYVLELFLFILVIFDLADPGSYRNQFLLFMWILLYMKLFFLCFAYSKLIKSLQKLSEENSETVNETVRHALRQVKTCAFGLGICFLGMTPLFTAISITTDRSDTPARPLVRLVQEVFQIFSASASCVIAQYLKSVVDRILTNRSVVVFSNQDTSRSWMTHFKHFFMPLDNWKQWFREKTGCCL